MSKAGVRFRIELVEPDQPLIMGAPLEIIEQWSVMVTQIPYERDPGLPEPWGESSSGEPESL